MELLAEKLVEWVRTDHEVVPRRPQARCALRYAADEVQKEERTPWLPTRSLQSHSCVVPV